MEARVLPPVTFSLYTLQTPWRTKYSDLSVSRLRQTIAANTRTGIASYSGPTPVPGAVELFQVEPVISPTKTHNVFKGG